MSGLCWVPLATLLEKNIGVGGLIGENFTGNEKSKMRHSEGNPGLLEVGWPDGGLVNGDKELDPYVLASITFWS